MGNGGIQRRGRMPEPHRASDPSGGTARPASRRLSRRPYGRPLPKGPGSGRPGAVACCSLCCLKFEFL